MSRRLDYVPLSDLQAAESNPKRHHDDLGTSITRFGFADAPILDERTGRLVAGHGRRAQLEELRAAGESPPEGVRLGEGGEWLVPVQRGWSSRSDKEAAAFLVAHNRVGEAGGWDDAELGKLLAEVEDLSGLAIDPKELDDLLAAAGLSEEPGEDPGAGEPPADPVSKRGEVYALGPHRLMCGDSTSAEDVAALLGGETPRLMVTDPPYGVEYDPSARDQASVRYGTTQARGKVTNDDSSEWVDAYALAPGTVAYVWQAPSLCPVGHRELKASGFLVRSMLVWVKPYANLTRSHYHPRHEVAWYAVRGDAAWRGDKKQQTVLEVVQVGNPYGRGDPTESRTSHGTQKPLACIEPLIRNHEGDVYDPFLGSGTTLIAAARQGRRCYGLEISPAYCDVIRKRWGDYARAAEVDPGADAL